MIVSSLLFFHSVAVLICIHLDRTSAPNNGCLRSPTSTNPAARVKKSVHFDCHLPRHTRSISPTPGKESCACRTNHHYCPAVTIASSSPLFISNGAGDNVEQRRRCDDQRVVGTLRERERIETTTSTTRTGAANPLTTATSTILRSLSLSPSPLSKEESNNDSRRRQREEKKENVDELNCTTSRRVTTAATHLQRTTTTATVTFNDGNDNIVSSPAEATQTSCSDTSTYDAAVAPRFISRLH